MPDAPIAPVPVQDPKSDIKDALIRTIVPYLTVFLVAKLSEWGFAADPVEVSAQLVLVLGSIYYGVVRWAEERWPAAGRLLIVAKTPTYATKGA